MITNNVHQLNQLMNRIGFRLDMDKVVEMMLETNDLEQSKLDLIADITHRVEDKIIEQSNAGLLIKLIKQAETLTEAIAIAELGTTYKRTGLHFDKRLEKFGNTIKYLSKNNELSFKTSEDGITHKLIIGDNYDALLNLLVSYRGMIDVIYIDPPYGKDSMGEFAQTNYDNALTRDNLLSMMYPRLVLANQLLSNDGLIFCSIDIRNYAYMKCLFDEVFGEKNCVATLNWKKKKQPSFLSNVASVMEYIIVYAKNASNIKKLSIESISDSNKPVVNAGNPVSERVIRKGCRVKADTTFISKGVYMNKTMNIEYLDDVVIKNGRTANDFRCKTNFRTTQENIDDYCNEDILFITKNLGLRRDLTEKEKGGAKAITDLLLDWGQNQDGSDELKDILKGNYFNNPKPVLLIKNLILSTMKKDPVVLDFFAGSGTTGQAVLELNKLLNYSAKFILCTNNEITSSTPNGIAFDVTSKRLKRIMTGSCYDGTKDFEWIKKNAPYGDNLDVYEIKLVANFENTEGKTPFDVIDETLYDQTKFNTIKEKVEWVCSNFEGAQKYIENDVEYKKRMEDK